MNGKSEKDEEGRGDEEWIDYIIKYIYCILLDLDWLHHPFAIFQTSRKSKQTAFPSSIFFPFPSHPVSPFISSLFSTFISIQIQSSFPAN
jgi:hypothetical protein